MRLNTVSNKLRFALAACGVVIALLVGLWAKENIWRINFAEKEMRGLKLLSTAQEVSQAALNSPISEAPLAANSFAKLAHFHKQIGAEMETKTTFANLEQAIQSQNPNTIHKENLEFIRQVGDQSNLILDPDLDSYYLMDLTLIKFPEAEELIGEIVLDSESVNLSYAARLSLASRIESHIQAVDRSSLTLLSNLRLRGEITSFTTQQNQYINSLKKLVSQLKDHKSFPEDSIKHQAYASLSSLDSFHRKTNVLLSQVLQARIDSLNTTRWQTLTLLVAIMLPIFFFFYRLTKQIAETMNLIGGRLTQVANEDLVTLEQFIAKLANGNLNMAISPSEALSDKLPITGTDDLARVGYNLNAMNDRIQSIVLSMNLCQVQLAQAQEEVTASERRFRSMAETLGEGLFLTDLEDRIIFANHQLAQMLGVSSPVELEGKSLIRFIPEEFRVTFSRRRDLNSTGKSDHIEIPFLPSTENQFWGLVQTTPFRDQAGTQIGTVNAVMDITERRQYEDQLRHHAFHDSLTGLPNRLLFTDRLERALARTKRTGSQVTVLFLDLDNFKVVNDSLGHESGDVLLKIVASRIQGCCRDIDTVARLGGDEFTVLLEELTEEQEAQQIAKRITNALQIPIRLEGQNVHIGVSIGIATGNSHIGSASQLLRFADTAMYEAKAQGKRQTVEFDDSMAIKAQTRLSLENDLREAIENGNLSIAYQPIVDLKSGYVTEVEALARWIHPERGNITPDIFIPIAEEAGLISALGRWVLYNACKEAGTFVVNPAGEYPTIAVNVSQYQLHDGSLLPALEAILAETGLPPSRLKLELTESAMMQNSTETKLIMAEIQKRGIRLAIDDFGTGYSSMSLLRDLPVDSIKIDRSFVNRIAAGREEDDAIIRAILNLSKSLNLYVVSEGIETEAQRNFLNSEGCELGQGYLFSKPISRDQLDLLFNPPRLPETEVDKNKAA
ncbi:hypothetical protein C0431_08090 [bacterium]|nr:hypothetical protein [bacterium]